MPTSPPSPSSPTVPEAPADAPPGALRALLAAFAGAPLHPAVRFWIAPFAPRGARAEGRRP